MTKIKLFDFDSVIACKRIEEKEVKRILYEIMGHRNKLSPHITRFSYINKKNLIPFVESVYWFTRFMEKKTSFVIRLFCIKNGITSYPACKRCGKECKEFNRNFTDGWFSSFCSRKCNRITNNPTRFMTKLNKEKRLRKISETRKRNYVDGFPAEWKNKLKMAANKPDVKTKKHNTCLKI